MTAMEQTAREICARLRERGRVAYFAGGCVRDLLRSQSPKDFDVATDARPEQVQQIFPRTYAVGAAFGLSAMGVASLVGLFYYSYSPFSLVAGVAMDRLGPRRVIPIGAACMGVGALLFSSGNTTAASPGSST